MEARGGYTMFITITNIMKIIKKSKVSGLEIVTMCSDVGYETFIRDLFHITKVDQYQSEEQASEGHKYWERFAEDTSNTEVSVLNAYVDHAESPIATRKLTRKK